MEPTSEDSGSYDHCTEDFSDFSDATDLSQHGNFYSVFIPSDVRSKDTPPSKHIFKDKIEAMKMVKKTKKARFKYFQDFHDALKFASDGIVDNPKAINGAVKMVSLTQQVAGERPSPFKGPKPQDLVKLRKSIETGDIEYFRQSIWENPRYLVSSGDTPSILQEGFRYNALHIAAKAKNGVIAEITLTTISDPRFVKLLYGDDQNENVENRIEVLLDLYLNTPDKGLNETPLHFAAKFGACDVVEVLVTFPQCDKTLKNKYGQTPDMIICDRCDNKGSLGMLKKKIALHLENCYYVPVLRAEDNSLPPQIGKPFSPGRPPVFYKDPLSPRLEIHAFAGPMNKEGAEQFRKVWKTPPRTSTPVKRKHDDCLDSVISLRHTDPTKGLERLGQKLATKYDVTWKEYWSFLDCFVDLGSDEGLGLLENYFAAKNDVLNWSYLSSVDTPEEGSKKSMSSISDLCMHLENCNIHDDSYDEYPDDVAFNAFLCAEKACNVFANRIACDIFHRRQDQFHIQVMLLESQTKQVELLVLSYLDDMRFNKVNFAQLHPRLGLLVGQKMCYLVDKPFRQEFVKGMKVLLATCVKAFDCFSSDDEGNYPNDNKPTTSKKQLICLLQNILDHFDVDSEPQAELDNEMDCKEEWLQTKECNCVFHFKRTRKSLGLSRNNSKLSRGRVTKKLIFPEQEERNEAKIVDDSSDDEDFFTPPSSPSFLHLSDSEDDYSDAPLASEMFIDGQHPTRTDNAVFKALKYSECHITPTKYPNVYRWYHNANLYTETERESWPRPKSKAQESNRSSTVSSPPHHISSPSSSWLRITRPNSPKTSVQGKVNV